MRRPGWRTTIRFALRRAGWQAQRGLWVLADWYITAFDGALFALFALWNLRAWLVEQVKAVVWKIRLRRAAEQLAREPARFGRTIPEVLR